MREQQNKLAIIRIRRRYLMDYKNQYIRKNRQDLKDVLENYCTKLRKYIEDLEDGKVEELTQFLKFLKKRRDISRPIDLDTIKIFFTLVNNFFGR